MMVHQGVLKLQKRGTGLKVPRFFVSTLLVAFILSVLPSCTKKQSKALLGHSSVVQPSLAVRQSEAQMVDMPLPVGGVLLPEHSKESGAACSHSVGSKFSSESTLSKGSVLTYRVAITRETLIRFYEDEMMRLGWNKVAQSSGDEEILVFESPSKMAIIQMRPEKPHKGWKQNKKIILTLHETSKEN